MDGVNLDFRDGALRAIARKAIERKTGARGLRSILENILMDPMFDIPTANDIQDVVISEEVVTDNATPLIVHVPSAKEAEPGA